METRLTSRKKTHPSQLNAEGCGSSVGASESLKLAVVVLVFGIVIMVIQWRGLSDFDGGDNGARDGIREA